MPPELRYRNFSIAKKLGGTRTISAPTKQLRLLQRKLTQVLYAVYKPRPSVHGFALNRSVATNASEHVGARYVFNIDISDFFPTINFGRVRGLFMAEPYKLGSEAATLLAQICCHANQLPQGAPTSPIVSNMICGRLDSELQKLGGKHHCKYTRYADDITFSKSRHSFPEELCRVDPSGEPIPGQALRVAIESNGFRINAAKVRIQSNKVRQSVTGLVVNKKINLDRRYIRQIRAQIHAWAKHGLDAATKEHAEKYRNDFKAPSLGQVILGKLEFVKMVKGVDDSVYKNLQRQLASVDPAYMERLVEENKRSAAYDIFISHASEDKDSFVRKLAEELVRIRIKVWYDEFELRIGDSLREKIDAGLSKSRYGVVVLSKAFFLKKWPQKELDGLNAIEKSGKKIILPIWYGVDEEDVVEFSPMLAGLYALKQRGKSISQIAKALSEAISEPSA